MAFESFTYSTPFTEPTSSSRCGTPAKVRSAAATASSGTPEAIAAAEAPMRVLEVVRPAQADLLGRQRQLPELDPARARPAPPPRAARPPPAPASGSRTRAASPRGRPRRSRDGRGGPRSRSAAVRCRGRTPPSPPPGSSTPRRRWWSRRPPPPPAPRAAFPRCRRAPPGRSASRQIAPSSSVVVVLPFVPVTATKRFGSSRQASSSSPSTGRPRSRAATITGASFGTPGLFTTQATRSSSSTPSTPRCASMSPGTSGLPESVPITSPCRGEHARGRDPGACEPDDQVRPLGEGRPHWPGIDAW